MSKRFIDTDIFKKGFVKGLQAPYKLLWMYLLNDCNHAGIWEVEIDIAEKRLGLVFETNPVEVFKDKIIVFDGGEKWFIPSFVEFQYGKLNPQNRAHNSVLEILNSYNLLIHLEKSKALTTPLQGCKDMDKDKDKDMDKEKPREENLSVSPLEKKICEYFKITPETHYNQCVEVGQFVRWLKTQGRDGPFEKEFTAYCEFKRISKSHVHSVIGFLGRIENEYKDGGWCKDNYTEALRKFNENENGNTKKPNTGFEPSYIATNADAKPIVHKYGRGEST